jgi:hydrophobic/amphiphilic exporter-1 (mainly G- bacteria), HAE1 family
MNISAIFIRRPIATSLLMAAIALFGCLAYRELPVSNLPDVDYPTISVNAGLPGGDPATMSSAVASPLERQFTTIAGIDSMTSSSSLGSSTVTMQFDLARDIDSATTDVQTAIAAVMPLLPAGMPAPPSFKKVNPADEPFLHLALTSRTVPLWVLDDYAETLIAPGVSMVSGVAQVKVGGATKYAVRVQVDPEKLRAEHIDLSDVDGALKNWNVNLPTGQLFGANATFNIQAGGQLMNGAAFQPLVVAYRHGAPVRLQQIANVIDGVEDFRNTSWLYTKQSGERAIMLDVLRQPDTNVIAIVDAIRRLFPAFERQLPPSLHLLVRGDHSKNIRKAFSEIQLTMAIALALVVGVIFLFLHNGSATLIPALALPFSILGTFSVMKLLHFSLDNLSMMALILSVGFIVDDAIVMLENIVRHMEAGEAPLEAALNGSKEICFTIVSMTVSLAAVFIPILFMAGILGQLFREFAVTIMAAILISGVVSVTLTPMLCSRFLHVAGLHAQRGFGGLMERLFNGLRAGYELTLRWVLRHRPVMLAVFVVVLLATVQMFRVVPKGFVPDSDDDEMNINLRAAQGTSFDDMMVYARRVADIIRQNPYVDMVMASSGGSGSMNTARVNVQLKPRADRPLTAARILRDLRPRISSFPGFQAFLNLPPAISIGGRQTNSTYQLIVQSLDTTDLYRWGARLEQEIARLPEVVDVNSDIEMKSPRVTLVIDRDRTAALQLNANDIENALYSGFGPKWSSTIYGPKTQYKVLLELDPRYQEHADTLESIAFKSGTNALVPLQSVVNFREDVGPQSIYHAGELPAVTISFAPRAGVSLGTALDRIQEVTRAFLPPTVTTSFNGTAKVFQDSLRNLGLLLFIAIGVVYIVLGMLYESYVHPITILSGLPSAGLGALVTLMLFGNELNIYSFVGLVMLVGIVKKNAIMQIDFALEAERHQDKSPTDAICEGCLIRFRPIMMTTMSALLGAVPVAVGLGSGGEARRPLGLAVVGGLLVSQLITLYLTPVVYTYMAAIFPARRRLPSTVAAKPLTA